MDKHTAENLDWFFNSMKPIETAYKDPEFSFIVHQDHDGPSLVAAKLILAPLAIDTPERKIKTGPFYAYSGRLSNISLTPRTLLERLLEGFVPGGDQVFKLAASTNHELSPRLFRSGGLTSGLDKQQQIYELFGFGFGKNYPHTEDVDWSLRSSDIPYGNINDLLSDFGLAGGNHPLQVIALPPILIDTTSRICGETGILRIRLAKSLVKENASIGVVVQSQGKAVLRKRLSGNVFDWQDDAKSNGVLVGTTNITVPKASVSHCFANYNTTSYHHYWIGDPDALQNPLRTMFEVFDPGLEVTKNLLSSSPKRGSSNDYESSVSWILWMLGFSPLCLGGSKKLSDGPDLIAISQDGNVIVVECTLGGLKTDNKLQKLIDRTNDVRRALERANAAHVICLPALVTSRPRSEIEDDIVEYEKRGIVVYTAEDIDPILGSTLTSPQSKTRFEELKQRIDDAQSRFESRERETRELARDVEDIKKAFNAIPDWSGDQY